MRSTRIFIGLVEVSPIGTRSVLGSSSGAFVKVVAAATSRPEFESLVASQLLEMDLHADVFDEVEMLSAGEIAALPDTELKQRAQGVLDNDGVPFFFTFNIYESDH